MTRFCRRKLKEKKIWRKLDVFIYKSKPPQKLNCVEFILIKIQEF